MTVSLAPSRADPRGVQSLLRGARRHAADAALDVLVVALAYFLATGVRLGGQFDYPEHALLFAVALGAGVVQMIANGVLGLYGRDWSIATFDDLLALVKASILVAGGLIALNILSGVHEIPFSAIPPGLGLVILGEGALKLRPRWRQIATAAVGGRGVAFARPDIRAAEIEAVVRVLRSGWLTTGPETQRFERAFADRLSVKHAIAVTSGTAALHLALEAAGIGPDDEVIVPTWTFTATAEVARYLGAIPVLVDVRPDDLNIDAAAVARAITPRTKAIVGVDLAGQPCDWHLLREIARPRGIVLVDDAAHALPSTLGRESVGKWADMTAFSFYVTKTLATGEGGMLVTDNDQWAERARVMSMHGISRDAWKRYTAKGSWRYEVVAPGFKYNLTDMAAALGLVQLSRVDEMRVRRKAIAERYTAAFAGMDTLDTPAPREDRTTSWHLYIIRLNLQTLRCDRAAIIEALKARGVTTSVHFIPLHLHPYWRDAYALRPEDYPVATREYERVISLPIYSAMSDDDVTAVIDSVQGVLRANHR